MAFWVITSLGKIEVQRVVEWEDLPIVRRTDLEQCDIESIWLEVTMPRSRGFLVGSYYRPPSSSKHNNSDFMNALSDTIEILATESKEVILIGDFNCDFSAVRSSQSECKQLKCLFKTLNYTQIINSPTRITPESSTLIDLIATNNPQNLSTSGVLSSSLSDHELTFCVRKLNWMRFPAEIKTFRNYANYNQEDFCAELFNVNWDDVLQPNDSTGNADTEAAVNDLWTNFKDCFCSIADKFAPRIKKKVRGNDCPWMNGEIKREIRQRDFLLKQARRTNRKEDWMLYRRSRNCVTNVIRQAKSKFSRDLIDENSDNPKNFWKTVNRIMPGEKKKKSTNIRINGTLISDEKEIANKFNYHFIETVNRLCQKFGCYSTSLAKSFSSPQNKPKNSFHFDEVTESFTRVQLKKLQTSKAVGLDQIPARLLRDSANLIAKPLTAIINFSLNNGCVPSEWKSARVIPLLKKGKAENLDNYRPVSILPAASKILERAVHILTREQLLNPYQCGFRKGHSTELAVLSFTDSIRRNMDQGLLTGAVFVDLSKAFDTIDHELLLQKLSLLYGIEGIELVFINDLPSN